MRLSSEGEYRAALEELATLQQAKDGEPAYERRRELEAATHDFAQRMKGAGYETGRPPAWQKPSGSGKS
jgi:hypothetical protein